MAEHIWFGMWRWELKCMIPSGCGWNVHVGGIYFSFEDLVLLCGFMYLMVTGMYAMRAVCVLLFLLPSDV